MRLPVCLTVESAAGPLRWGQGRALAALLLVAASTATPASAQTKSPIVIDALAGSADLQRMGALSPLRDGDALVERDLLLVPAHSRVRLAAGSAARQLIDLGSDSELALEKLPAASTGDTKTIVTLVRGRARLFWSRAAAGPQPLHVYFNGLRASVTDGELYVENEPQHQRACVVFGQAVLIPLADAPMTLTAPLCYDVHGSGPATVAAGDAALWKSLRIALGPDPDVIGPSTSIITLAQDAAAVAAPPAVTASGRLATRLQTLPSAPPPTASPPANAAPPLDSPTSTAPSPATTTAVAPAALPTAPPAPSAGPDSVPLALPSTGSWSLNLASLEDPAVAAREVQRLQAAGYAAVSQQAVINGRTWYRVQVPGFASAELARAKSEDIKTQLGFRGAWLLHVP